MSERCHSSCEPVEGSLSVLADYIGPHKIMWATDCPHSDGFFPGAPQMIGEQIEPLSPEAKHQVLAGGATGCYGLHLTTGQPRSLGARWPPGNGCVSGMCI